MSDVDPEDGGCRHGSEPDCCVVCGRLMVYSDIEIISDLREGARNMLAWLELGPLPPPVDALAVAERLVEEAGDAP